MSAASSSAAFDLRCEIREKMVVWLQEHHPRGLPPGTDAVRQPQGGEGAGAERAPAV